MTKDKKKKFATVCRWVLFALAVVSVGGVIALCTLVPDEKILRYSDGKFCFFHTRESYGKIFLLILLVQIIAFAGSVILDLSAKQRLSEKLFRTALSVLLGFIAFAAFCFSGVMLSGFFPEMNLPFNAAEYDIGGHKLVLAQKPHGLHHSLPALYEIDGENAEMIGFGTGFDPDLSETVIEPTEGGCTVYYTYYENDAAEQKSFTAKYKE